MAVEIPPIIQATFDEWLEIMRAEWHGEIPTKIHSRDLDQDGMPQWSPEFSQWIYADPNPRRLKDEHRLRTTRAMRKLRRKCIREFDVLYLMVAKKMSYAQVAEAMTERAIRFDKPERYDVEAIRILALSGLDKLARWW